MGLCQYNDRLLYVVLLINEIKKNKVFCRKTKTPGL